MGWGKRANGKTAGLARAVFYLVGSVGLSAFRRADVRLQQIVFGPPNRPFSVVFAVLDDFLRSGPICRSRFCAIVWELCCRCSRTGPGWICGLV